MHIPIYFDNYLCKSLRYVYISISLVPQPRTLSFSGRRIVLFMLRNIRFSYDVTFVHKYGALEKTLSVSLLGLRGTDVFDYSRNYFGIVLFLELCYHLIIDIN